MLYIFADSLLFIIGIWSLLKIVKWAKGMPKAAFLMLAIFPLISIFPIPPPTFKNVEKAKIEQRKNKQNDGDSDDG
ncbi:hypothetical protein D5R81_12675 [Parashewanella spongiae]|uniref:Uncharacterized protein n=1 Tax=Parashewanella spongiae TaxID=342950 RepID=A0A3A6TGF4_9GAMM|nr:hypothetical protein [Parashewanella spongiae]MCL1078773.1 hypothetical protein [Parashewanella spongiae]RJY12228.1 hypothetical protein D5R81_12675 [Parashewanella spongiae]